MLLLFAGEEYYPSGGGGDFVMKCESFADVDNWWKNKVVPLQPQDKPDWAHLFDTDSGQVVYYINLDSGTLKSVAPCSYKRPYDV